MLTLLESVAEEWWTDEGASYGSVYDGGAFSDFFGIDFDKADKEREDNAKAVKG